MIVPMKKVSLVILSREKEAALKTLRASGLLHLQNVEGKGEKLSELKNVSAKLRTAQAILAEMKIPQKNLKMVSATNEEAASRAEKIVALAERKKNLLDKIAQSAAELERLAPWGIVNPADLAFLSQKVNRYCVVRYTCWRRYGWRSGSPRSSGEHWNSAYC